MRSLPKLEGRPLDISIRPQLTAFSGSLLSGFPFRGTPVHAAAFIRERRIVIEQELLGDRAKLRLIFLHELFHFAWVRLGNPSRAAFGGILEHERQSRARGELGESSALEKCKVEKRKVEKRKLERNALHGWRSYRCESFCDTAAWMYAGVRNHSDFRLAERWRQRRREWFENTFASPRYF